MALAHILRTTFPDKDIFAYTVDHGLRTGSSTEADQVGNFFLLSPGEGKLTHRILQWMGEKPTASIQENARNARYELLLQACAEDDISVLCVAHHADDQAETILHRLAKGSGLDGLGGMKTISPLYHPGESASNVALLRPLLHATHAELIHYCQTNAIKWIEDPSNENEKFARVRLRKAHDVLAQEGLTTDRLTRLGLRMQHAAEALDYYAEQAFENFAQIVRHSHESGNPNQQDPSLRRHDVKEICVSADALTLPREILIRMIIKAAGIMGQEDTLRSNLKRLEDFCSSDYITKRQRITLANLILTVDPKKGINVEPEKHLD